MIREGKHSLPRPFSGLRLVALAGALSISVNARADSSEEDRGKARALFDAALKDIDAEDCVQALPKLRASHQLYASINALLYTGQCYVKLRHFVSARTSFKDAAALARKQANPEREKLAESKASETEPHVSTLTIRVAPGARVDGLTIRQDGRIVDPATWGVALSVDGGTYSIEVSAPDHITRTDKVKVGDDGDHVDHSVTSLQEKTRPPPPPSSASVALSPVPPPLLPAAPVLSSSPDTTPASTGPWRTVGFGLGGAGLVAGVVGGILLGSSLSKASDASDAHDRGTYDSARSLHTSGLVLGGLGVAMLVSGIVLVTSNRTAEKTSTAWVLTPSAGPRQGGLWLSSRW